MTRRRFIFALFLWAVLPAALLSAAYQTGLPGNPLAETVVLYDGRLGTTPDQQGFTILVVGTSANQQYVDGATVLDTSADSSEQAGYFNRETQSLDRELGYKVQFTIRVDKEEHLSLDRAGFSVLVLSNDLLGLELAFWEGEIWAQEGGLEPDLFTHAEGVPFDTTAGQVAYELSILDEAYTLSADGVTLLNGPLRDYTAFEGFPDVYETPGLLFLGDNTTRGAAKTAVSYVALEISSEPTPTPPATATPTPQPAATATPAPGDKLYVWLPCLKGVADNTQK